MLLLSCRKPVSTNTPAGNNKSTEEQLVEVNRILVKKDRQKITGYINRKGWNMMETETGLWYEILEEGSGDSAKSGQLATMEYTVRLLDGTICYTSNKNSPKTFLIGKGNVESGIEQGVLLLKEGTKARFILPPYLAHGLPGDGDKIPARSIIIYELELLSLTNPQ
ncbi:MAG: FKBP-type peptidyl-prolyl cis-trans isomerase [Bacteroidales bacterium]|nr:FKBP-type peptidyl-prolyl cis-trans isomerase [Bacteroidales bacterium]MBN2819282.1 FKBP-type peptidyl-prolyl cis-trans isomerase [Bacteroidales bacterium]